MFCSRGYPFLILCSVACFIASCFLGALSMPPPDSPQKIVMRAPDKSPRDAGTRHVQSVLDRQYRRVLTC